METEGADLSIYVQSPISLTGIYFALPPAHKACLRAIIAAEKPLVECRALQPNIFVAQKFSTRTPSYRSLAINRDLIRHILDRTEDQECLQRL